MQEKYKNNRIKSASFHGVFFNQRKDDTHKKDVESSTASQSITSKTSNSRSPRPNARFEQTPVKLKLPSTAPARTKPEATVEKVVTCGSCLKFMQQEIQIIEKISNITNILHSSITSIQSWKQGRIDFPLETLPLGVTEMNFEFESTRKINELCRVINEMNVMTVRLAEEVSLLSQTSSWECVKLKPAEEIHSDGVLGTITRAKECVSALQGLLISESSPICSNSSLLQCLSLQLAQSKRERRALEAMIHLDNSLSTEKVSRGVESLLSKAV